MPAAAPPNEAEIRATLSAPRAATYVAAAGGDTARAVELYGWNARVSAAFMLPAHFYRNVSDLIDDYEYTERSTSAGRGGGTGTGSCHPPRPHHGRR